MQTTPKMPTPEEIEAVLAQGKKGRLLLWLITIVLIGGLIAAVVWWQYPREQEIHWQTQPIDRGDIVLTANATGTLQPRRTVTIGAEISGKIATVEVENNERIARDQVLATFDTTTLKATEALARAGLLSSQASLRRAEASLAEAELEEKRTVQLVEQEVAPKAEADAARTRTIRAQADLDQARADLERARAQLADVQTQLDQTVITSPIDGVILARQVEPGQTVASSLQAPELFIAAEDLARMTLEVWIDEADIGLVQAGQKATFQVSAYPGRQFEAQVETLDLQSTTTNNVVTYTAQLAVENEDYLLRPGMTAQTTITTGEQNDALRVPNRALRFQPPELDDNGGDGAIFGVQVRRFRGRGSPGPEGIGTVHVLRDGVPTPIRVNTGRTDGQFTAIESDELKEGDEILVGFTLGPLEGAPSPGGPGARPGAGGGPPRGGGR